MNLKIPDWVNELQASLQREFGNGPNIAALATVDADGQPQARSIVIREIAADGAIRFVTDGRSAKVTELSISPKVQLLIWLPSLRVQYRLSGEAQREVELATVVANWDRLSEASKAMFFWNTPAARIDGCAGTLAAPRTDVPRNFAVYRVVLSKADFLSLTVTPHLRWISCESDGWKRDPIDP